VCPAGYLYPLCRTPLDEFATVFGGIVGFAAVIGAVLIVIVAVLLWLYFRRVAAAKALERSASGIGQLSVKRSTGCCGFRDYSTEYAAERSSLLRASENTHYSVPDEGVPIGAAAQERGSAAMAAALDILHKGKRGGACTFWSYGQDKHAIDFLISSTALQEFDLHRLVHRVYLSGSNTFGSPWRLPAQLPKHALRYVRWRQYRLLCSELNAELEWPAWSWGRALHLLCYLVFPPAGSYLHRWLRRQRVWAAMTRLLASDESHRWLKGARAAALQVGGSSRILGTSCDLAQRAGTAHQSACYFALCRTTFAWECPRTLR
jgi:hypothetical protein